MTKQSINTLIQSLGEVPTALIIRESRRLIRQRFYGDEDLEDLEQELTRFCFQVKQTYERLSAPTATYGTYLFKAIRRYLAQLRARKMNERQHFLSQPREVVFLLIDQQEEGLSKAATDTPIQGEIPDNLSPLDASIVRWILAGYSPRQACRRSGVHHSYFARTLRPRLQSVFF